MEHPGPWKFVSENIEAGQYCDEIKDANDSSVMGNLDYYPHIYLTSEEWRIVAAAPELLKALRAAALLLKSVTVRQVIEAGDEAIAAVGLNPWCMNEGRATGDEHVSLDFIHDVIAKATTVPVAG